MLLSDNRNKDRKIMKKKIILGPVPPLLLFSKTTVQTDGFNFLE